MKEKIKNKMIKILGIEYRIILSFYSKIRGSNADYAIFVTRRCYILYHIFSFVEGWDALQTPQIISDRAIWFNRHNLKRANEILVIDDVLWHGNTIKNVIVKLKTYVNCKISPLVYCIYEQAISEHIEISNYSHWCIHDRFACGQLSDRLVRCITENGIPYSTFVFSWYGNAKRSITCLNNIDDRLIHINPLEDTHETWIQNYDFNIPENIQEVVSKFAYTSCIRIYNNKTDLNYCVMPFSFVKNVKYDKIEEFFSTIQNIILLSGNTVLSQEISNALNDNDNTHDEDKWVYLMTIFSCLLSRFIGLEMGIDDWFLNRNSDIEKIAIMGSFPVNVVKSFIELDKKFAENFTNQLKNCKTNWDKYFLKEDLINVINEEKSSKTCIDSLIDIFQNRRNEFEELQEEEKRFYTCSDIFNLLAQKQYNINQIYAAQISCWDQGIAGYIFKYYKDKGIISINGIGERSSLIISLRNKKSLEKYFSWELMQSRLNKQLSEEERVQKLKEIMHSQNTPIEDQKTLLSDMNNLYQYYIF